MIVRVALPFFRKVTVVCRPATVRVTLPLASTARPAVTLTMKVAADPRSIVALAGVILTRGSAFLTLTFAEPVDGASRPSEPR